MDPRELIAAARLAGRASLNEADGKRLLAAFGVAVPRFSVISGAESLASALQGMAAPFAVKVLSQDILHKSDAGAVILDAAGPDAVRAALSSIASQPQVLNARVDGYLVEEMCPPGVELAIGAVRDPFGNVLGVVENPEFRYAPPRIEGPGR